MQIDYTSRDFAALKADLVDLIKERTNTTWDPTDYSDLGNVLVETFAYMGDIMSHYLDRIANETTIDTAIQRKTLLSFAKLYDYVISGPTPATVNVTFTNISSNTIDIPTGTQVMAPLSFGAYSEVYFETTTSATAIVPGASITLPCQEGKTVNTDKPDLIDSTFNIALPANLGTSDGRSTQSFTIPESGVVNKSITVYVGQGVAFGNWTYVDNLFESGPNDRVFTTSPNEDGTVDVVFGDNVNGAIPQSGQLISATYKLSVGSAGNIKSLSVTELTFFPGNLDPQITSYFTVSNSAPASGGTDGDTLINIKNKIKAAVSTRRRAVTLEDFSYLANLAEGVGKASAASSVYTNVNLYVQPLNDGQAATGYPQANITGIATTGTVVTFATDVAHGFAVGNTLNISGVDPIAYNLQNVVIASVPSPVTFTVASTLTAPYTGNGLAISLTPTSAWTNLSYDVQSYMSDKILAGTTLSVLPPTYVPIYITATVTADSAWKNADVKLGIYQAMLGETGLFYYDNNTFGKVIPLSTITSAIQNVPGVVSATVTQLSRNASGSVGTLSLAANEIPYLLSTSLVTTVTGGI
jgi:uncharacterized phage protein gp47/JayE